MQQKLNCLIMHTEDRIGQFASTVRVPGVGSLEVFFAGVLLFEEDDLFSNLLLHLDKQFNIMANSLFESDV
jgi:hypothetical protein